MLISLLIYPQAIARAAYSKHEFLVLDDVFSGLDATTENAVFHNLLGPHGLLRKAKMTVVLASSNGTDQITSAADYADND